MDWRGWFARALPTVGGWALLGWTTQEAAEGSCIGFGWLFCDNCAPCEKHKPTPAKFQDRGFACLGAEAGRPWNAIAKAN